MRRLSARRSDNCIGSGVDYRWSRRRRRNVRWRSGAKLTSWVNASGRAPTPAVAHLVASSPHVCSSCRHHYRHHCGSQSPSHPRPLTRWLPIARRSAARPHTEWVRRVERQCLGDRARAGHRTVPRRTGASFSPRVTGAAARPRFAAAEDARIPPAWIDSALPTRT